MNLELRNIRPEKGVEAAYTANLYTTGIHFLNVLKLAANAFPDLSYTSHAEAPTFYEKATLFALELGFPHIHAYIQHLYVTRNDAKETELLKARHTKAMQELCSTACVFTLPRHRPGEYEVSREAPSAARATAAGIDVGKAKKIPVDSPVHREYLRRQYAEVGAEITRFLGDDYPKAGLLL